MLSGRKINLTVISPGPHFPFQDGNSGTSSSRNPGITRDLTGIRTKFDPPDIPTIDGKGSLSSVFIKKGYFVRSEIERDNCKYRSRIGTQSKEAELEFLDRILVEMENNRRESHERRERHFTSSKASLGFETGEYDFSIADSDHNPHSGSFNTRTLTSHADNANNVGLMPREGDKTPQALLRKKKAFNRATLFRCLLESLEPPRSPKKRFGSLSMDKSTFSASAFDSRIKSAKRPQSSWDERSILRASLGDNHPDFA